MFLDPLAEHRDELKVFMPTPTFLRSLAPPAGMSSPVSLAIATLPRIFLMTSAVSVSDCNGALSNDEFCRTRPETLYRTWSAHSGMLLCLQHA